MTRSGKEYDALAPVYDLLQEEVDPARWADFVLNAAALHGRVAAGAGDGADGRLLALDLGCGTGSIAVELVARGFDVIGIDRSEDMLGQAREKADRLGIAHGEGGLTLIRQDISDFELYGTVDLILCFMDTVNHLPSGERVRRMFRLCRQYLNPGGLFLFDIATPRHFSETLGNQVFYDLSRDIAMIWKNTYDPVRKTSRADIALFLQDDDQRYNRVDAVVRERAYAVADIRRWLSRAGFSIAAEYGGVDREPAGEEADRVFFAAVREKTGQECYCHDGNR